MDAHTVGAAQPGDILILRDLHTLEALGQDTDCVITHVREWQNAHLQYRGLECSPVEGTILMLVQRRVRSALDTRIFRAFDQGTGRLESMPGLFIGDQFWHDVSIPALGVSYTMKSPYPFWDLRLRMLAPQDLWSPSADVGLAEYVAPDLDRDAWHKHLLVLAWFHTSHLVEAWLGWRVDGSDFEVLTQ